jgi:hypothetical protein
VSVNLRTLHRRADCCLECALIAVAPPSGAKFIVDKTGKVVERNDKSPMASEALIKSLL